MGVLAECTTTPLTWSEIVPHVERIKELALGQFIAIYNQLKDRDERDQLRWGDEIEYVLVRFDEAKKKARVSLRAEELLQELSVWETMNDLISYENRTLWRPEFASYMIEGTPGTPYGGLLESFRDVEKNMCLRRAELDRLLHENESLMSISFPALGVPDFTDPPMQKLEEDGKPWVSDFFSEEMINKCHPRFVYLTRNIIERRGGDRMSVNVPIFRDKCTPTPFIDEFVDPRVQHQLAKPDHIFLDHIGFGTGLCCLQVTIQGSDMDEARWLYDQLAPLTPLMVALSAATPIYRGMLANVDARWDVLAKLSDDRNPEERAKGGKTRFGTIDCFIHPTSAQFNDIPVPYEERVMARLLAEGVDPAMAQHIAHLFIWDPLLVYAENLEQNKENGKAEENGGGNECTADDDLTTHFDSLQSSIWSSLRFKPPPSQRLANRLGWRVEFRPMEVQLTDFENAAFCCFLVLLSRVLLSDRLSLVMPISLIDQNMERAQQRDAVIEQKFHFRTDLERHGDRKVLKENGKNGQMNGQMGAENVENGENEEGTKTTTINVRQMTVNEIINGDGADFPGLVPLCLRWLDSAGDAPLDVQTRGLIIEYLQFVQKRATGECATLARWMREFVAKHPDYKKDSLCPDSAIYDLLKEMDRMAKGENRSERLLGNFGQRKWLLEAKAAGKWRIHPNGKEKETGNELK